jgi:hypothetical protein
MQRFQVASLGFLRSALRRRQVCRLLQERCEDEHFVAYDLRGLPLHQPGEQLGLGELRHGRSAHPHEAAEFGIDRFGGFGPTLAFLQ